MMVNVLIVSSMVLKLVENNNTEIGLSILQTILFLVFFVDQSHSTVNTHLSNS